MNLEGVVWSEVTDAPVRELNKGVRIRTLWKGDNGAKALIFEVDPGCRLEELDVHEPGPEEVYVLSGVFNDGARDYPAGTFIHHPTGTSHIPQSITGCKLFVFMPEG
jgi:anti-sigma factor ChrR (cupin superfamily)